MTHFSADRIRELLANNRMVENGIIEFPLDFKGEQKSNIVFRDIKFSDLVSFIDITNAFIVKFEFCTFEEPVFIGGGNFRELRFDNCLFENTLDLNDVITEHYTQVNCSFAIGSQTEKLKAENVRLETIVSNKNRLAFSKCSIKSCLIADIKENTEIIISSYDSFQNKYLDCVIGRLVYHSNSQYKGLLLIAGIQIDYFALHGDNISSRINCKDLKVTNVDIGHFTNSGLVSFSNIEPSKLNSKLTCFNANLGKCEIYDVDFSRFNNIAIENACIQDIIATNVTWCKKVANNLYSQSKISYQREVYRQLKNVMIRQNDKVQELMYHSYEMDAHLADLRMQKGTWPDRFILWTNRVSNEHGHSWRRAIFLLVLISLFVFILNKILLGSIYFDQTQIFKNIGLFLESINPVRKFSAIYYETKEGTMAGLAYAIDVIYRIVSSYLLFQFISAFRKYVKK